MPKITAKPCPICGVDILTLGDGMEAVARAEAAEAEVEELKEKLKSACRYRDEGCEKLEAENEEIELENERLENELSRAVAGNNCLEDLNDLLTAEVERLKKVEEERWSVVATRNAAIQRAEKAEAERNVYLSELKLEMDRAEKAESQLATMQKVVDAAVAYFNQYGDLMMQPHQEDESHNAEINLVKTMRSFVKETKK